jgi:hypothetical protein
MARRPGFLTGERDDGAHLIVWDVAVSSVKMVCSFGWWLMADADLL